MFELLISKQYSVVLKDSSQLVKLFMYVFAFWSCKKINIFLFSSIFFCFTCFSAFIFFFLYSEWMYSICWKKKNPLNNMNSKQLNNYNITVWKVDIPDIYSAPSRLHFIIFFLLFVSDKNMINPCQQNPLMRQNSGECAINVSSNTTYRQYVIHVMKIVVDWIVHYLGRCKIFFSEIMYSLSNIY